MPPSNWRFYWINSDKIAVLHYYSHPSILSLWYSSSSTMLWIYFTLLAVRMEEESWIEKKESRFPKILKISSKFPQISRSASDVCNWTHHGFNSYFLTTTRIQAPWELGLCSLLYSLTTGNWACNKFLLIGCINIIITLSLILFLTSINW